MKQTATFSVLLVLATLIVSNYLLWEKSGVFGQSQTAQVTIFEYGFNPRVLNITTGTTVTWMNSGSLVHTATDNESTPYWDSGSIAPSGSYSKFFGQPGLYQYYCTIHPFMKGYVNVTGSAVQPPQSSSNNAPYLIGGGIVAVGIAGSLVFYFRRNRILHKQPPATRLHVSPC